MRDTNKSNGLRAIFTPASEHSDAILRPICSECGAITELVGIEAEPRYPDYELHTFQCPECKNFELAIGKTAEANAASAKRYAARATNGR